MMVYDWRLDERRMAYLLTVTQGNQYVAVLIDPNPPTRNDFLGDVAFALKEATKTLVSSRYASPAASEVG